MHSLAVFFQSRNTECLSLSLHRIQFPSESYIFQYIVPLPPWLNLLFLFISFWLCWVLAAARAFSLVVVRGHRIAVASPVAEHRLSRVRGLQEAWYVGLVAAVPGLWSTGLVAVVHGRTGSSQTSDLTLVSCTGKWTLSC